MAWRLYLLATTFLYTSRRCSPLTFRTERYWPAKETPAASSPRALLRTDTRAPPPGGRSSCARGAGADREAEPARPLPEVRHLRSHLPGEPSVDGGDRKDEGMGLWQARGGEGTAQLAVDLAGALPPR